MRTKTLIFLMIFLAFAALVACNTATTEPTAQDTASQTETTPSNDTAAETIATQTPDPATAKLIQQLNGAVVMYHKSGGIAGIDEVWMVYPDGRITRNDETEWQVTPEAVTQLVSNMETAGLFQITAGYTSPPICCDQFTHVLTVQQGEKVVQITAVDGDSDAPEAIWPSIQSLNTLLTTLP